MAEFEIINTFAGDNGHEYDVCIQGTYDNILFKAGNISSIFDIKNIRDMIVNYDDSEKVIVTVCTNGGKQPCTFLTEKGLQKIVFNLQKPIAYRFFSWALDVTKEIRHNHMQKRIIEEQEKLNEMQKQIDTLEAEHNIPKMYIFDMDTRPTSSSEKELKIGLTRKSLGARAKPFRQNCKFGEMIFSIEVPTHVNLKQFEDWIHTLLKNYRITGEGEVFKMDVELAKMWMIYALRMVQVADCKDESQKRLMLAKLVDSHNKILGFESGSALKHEIATQTDDIPIAETPVDTETQEAIIQNEFDTFIDNECVIGDDLEVSSTEICGKYRIWAQSAKKESFHLLLEYLNKRFRPVRLSVQNKDQVVNGFRGVSIKQNDVTLSIAPSDPEIFLWHMCDYKPNGKILLNDLYHEYQRWAARIGKKVDDSDLREYLADCEHVLISNVWTHNGSGRGVYGVCLKNDPSQYKHRKPSATAKLVQKRDAHGNVVDEWTTIAKAAQAEGVAAARMSRIISNSIIHNGFRYMSM